MPIAPKLLLVAGCPALSERGRVKAESHSNSFYAPDQSSITLCTMSLDLNEGDFYAYFTYRGASP